MTDRRGATRRGALKFGAIGSFGAVTGLIPMVSQAAPEGIQNCTTIDEPGEYELKNDITGGGTLGPDDDACIAIQAGDVTLDGNGYTLEGDGDGVGIRIGMYGPESTVRNLTVRNFDRGIAPEYGSVVAIDSVTVEGNVEGIRGNLSDLTCTNSVVRDNDGNGIYLSNETLTVRNCEIRDNGGIPIGMCCRGSVVVEACEIVGNGGPVGFTVNPDTRIEGSVIAGSSEEGIATSYGDVHNSPDEPVRITDCYIHDNDGPGISHDSGYLEVRQCTLAGNRDGYYADGIEVGSAVLRYNNVENNEEYGAFFRKEFENEVDAECNYWGDESGPKHQNNPRSDPKGERVTESIDVTPWSVERIEDGEGVCIGGQERVGYISLSSFTKVTGDDEVACVPDEDGWGDSFYIRREARNGWSDEGVVVDVPNSSQSFRGYLISAEADTTSSGGPSGEGPWGEDCSSWLFVNEAQEVQFDVEHDIHDLEPTVAHETVQPTNGDGDDVGLPLDLVRTTFAPFAEAE
ncbi:right-handed parallel beta-helix repeat-containing protein [Halobellus rarus]|uniref:Right-handed parallel beta-helix repeat-containing protein n=1 Tax=Halobellus rarus TaxID=1126237 RepID=A0ABD6CIB8_9EURY|nr:right-handed parallel beta-helix repeat-containing protein [Halobellus rarus]